MNSMKRFVAGLLLSCILLTIFSLISQSCWAVPSSACCCPKTACHCDSDNGNFKSCDSDSIVPVPWTYSIQKPVTPQSYEMALLPSQNLFPLFFNPSVGLAFHPRPWLVPPNGSPQARLNIWLI